MEQIRPLTSLSHDELVARIEQYQVLLECRHTEIRELHAIIERRDATIMTLQRDKDAEVERLRDALTKVRCVIDADRQALIDTHGIDGAIPPDDEEGALGLYEYDGALHTIDAALNQQETEE